MSPTDNSSSAASYTTCNVALHAVRNECAHVARDPDAYKACMASKNVHVDAKGVRMCTAPTPCVIAGDSRRLYTCTHEGSQYPQTVHGMGWYGKPSRVVGAGQGVNEKPPTA